MNARIQPARSENSGLFTANDLSPLLKAAADPLRLEILRLLSTESFGVMELCHIFEIKQSSMSHHLKVMANAGLVTTRREGNSIFYRRQAPAAEQATSDLQHSLYLTIDTLVLSDTLQRRVNDIHHQRAEASRQFFSQHAAEFKEKQDLIAAYEVYAEQVAQVLHESPLPGRQQVLEVGSGEGQFLQVLSGEFEQVCALDNSASLLNSAQAFCAEKALNNITFVHNDTRWCASARKPFDCVVINMVLHHTPSPAQIFSDVSSALGENGVLLVCDLCNHDQDWVRDACGDLWLGFEPQDLTRWASDTGFSEGQSVYFALRNGFQIQIRQFIKEQP